MAEFERYKKNTRKEELEYEAALRAKPIDQLTPYEIGLLADWNESFYGDELDEKKLRQYAEVKDLAVQFLSAGKMRSSFLNPHRTGIRQTRSSTLIWHLTECCAEKKRDCFKS